MRGNIGAFTSNLCKAKIYVSGGDLFMTPYYHEPSPQTNLDGTHTKQKDGSTIRLSGKGKHFEEIKKQLEQEQWL
jgi:hypothetical protein